MTTMDLDGTSVMLMNATLAYSLETVTQSLSNESYNDTMWTTSTPNNCTLNCSAVLDNSTSSKTLSMDDILVKKFATVFYTYLGPSICAFGIMCNILNLLVLTQRQLKESPYTYLTGLAITDLGALILSFVFMVISHKQPGVYIWRFYEAHIYYPFVNICTNSSVWITVLLTIERFLFVRHPLWAKATCDRASAKVKIALIVVIIFILDIPRFLVFEVSYHKGVPYLDHTEFRTSKLFHAISWIYAMVINFIPLMIVSFANIYLVMAVKRARLQREVLQIRNNKEAAWQREQVRLTITLISIVCLFIICIIPSAFADFPIAYAFFGEGHSEDDFRKLFSYRVLQYVSNVLVLCNLSINFVLYCAFNNKFRRVMRWMFKCWPKCLQFSRKDGSVLLLVNFKNGHSITRNNSSQTNSISLNTKVSAIPTEALLKSGKCTDMNTSNSMTTSLYEKVELTKDHTEECKNI